MKTLIIAAALLALPAAASAATDYYLKLGGVDGETNASVSGGTLTVQGNLTVESGTAKVGQTVILDATKSSDDGTVHRFVWKQTSGPTVTLSNAATANASFVPQTAGTYVFELSTTDVAGETSVARRVEVAVSLLITGDPDFDLLKTSPSGEEKKKGNVEYDWKVEEGEKGGTEDLNIGIGELESIEPDEIDYDENGEPITPDFGILLGGGSGSDDEERAQGLKRALEILEENAKASDQAIESVSLNFEKIQTKVKHEVKLFGVIPAVATATVEVDAEENVKVKFPWWAFLATGKDSEALGQQIFNTLSNVLKTKHDTIKNSIGNIR